MPDFDVRHGGWEKIAHARCLDSGYRDGALDAKWYAMKTLQVFRQAGQ